MMTIDEVRQRVADIRACAGDPESAHGMEDRLRADVLRAIAEGDLSDVGVIMAAAIALTTSDIKFSRWCA